MLLPRMTAIAIRAPGGPEMLVPEERPVPVPGPGEILVGSRPPASTVPTCASARATILRPRARPIFPAWRLPARSWRLAPTSSAGRLGDKVCALVVGGGYAQYCLAYEPMRCRCRRRFR